MGEGSELLVVGGAVVRARSDGGYVIEERDIAVRDGRITALAAPGAIRPHQANRVLSADGCLVTPGFVNAHSHSYGTLGRTFGTTGTLEPWMAFANAITVNRTPDEIRLAVLLGCIELVRSGTTTVLDHLGGRVTDLSVAAQTYLDFGLRAVLAPMVSDVPLHRTVGVGEEAWPADLWRELEAIPPASTSTLLSDMRDLLNRWHETAARIRIFVGPSGPQRCTDELLAGCARLATDFGTGVHTHLLETRNQARVTRDLYGESAVEHLDRLGLLNDRFVGAHGVWCETDDLRLLGSRGAALVHNPWSNLYVGSGVAPVPAWQRNGVRYALGTDGSNCGCDLSMPLAMRLAANLHRTSSTDPGDWPTPEQTFEAATSGGARALGWASDIGSVEEGMAADLAVIDLQATVYHPRHNLIAQLVHGESGRNVRHTVVAGRVVMEDWTILVIDETDLLGKAQEAQATMLGRNEKLLRLAERQVPTLTDAAGI